MDFKDQTHVLEFETSSRQCACIEILDDSSFENMEVFYINATTEDYGYFTTKVVIKDDDGKIIIHYLLLHHVIG